MLFRNFSKKKKKNLRPIINSQRKKKKKKTMLSWGKSSVVPSCCSLYQLEGHIPESHSNSTTDGGCAWWGKRCFGDGSLISMTVFICSIHA